MFNKILKPIWAIFVILAFVALPADISFSVDNMKCTPLKMAENKIKCSDKTSSGNVACGSYSYEVKVDKDGKCDIPASGWKCTEATVTVAVGKQTCTWITVGGETCQDTSNTLTNQSFTDCSDSEM